MRREDGAGVAGDEAKTTPSKARATVGEAVPVGEADSVGEAVPVGEADSIERRRNLRFWSRGSRRSKRRGRRGSSTMTNSRRERRRFWRTSPRGICTRWSRRESHRGVIHIPPGIYRSARPATARCLRVRAYSSSTARRRDGRDDSRDTLARTGGASVRDSRESRWRNSRRSARENNSRKSKVLPEGELCCFSTTLITPLQLPAPTRWKAS